jgi:Fe-S-cluster containining protein
VKPRDPVVKKQPSFVVDRGTYLEIRRDGDRCAALQGEARYHCVIYDDRPKTCRDFTLGSAHCLTARRRVGLSLNAAAGAATGTRTAALRREDQANASCVARHESR